MVIAQTGFSWLSGWAQDTQHLDVAVPKWGQVWSDEAMGSKLGRAGTSGPSGSPLTFSFTVPQEPYLFWDHGAGRERKVHMVLII